MYVSIYSFRYIHVITSRKFQYKRGVSTDGHNSVNEIEHWTNDESGVAV